MAELRTLARPYAKAAFSAAQELNQLAEWDKVLTVAGQVTANADIRRLLANPGLEEQKKAELILEVAGEEATDQVRNFFSVLAGNQRLALLPEIAVLFNTYRADLERTVDIDVTSAFELTDEQQQKLAQALSEKLERKVSLAASLDKSLIGGAVIRTGDLVIDASVRGKLKKLVETLGS
ncbi:MULTISPECIES: F0F1 ATP synthase subunit delta [Marinobacter]|uniref:ATP synthase subunit delta n=1 Tax=Marinobacter suaedae TaxID=3057675 RepID=A0ABT8VZK1_9GAMM|nr:MULTISPECIES: F0F1 ATP synthase subunit delta [unclassified Marinobacter]MBZ2169529.1 F0F1 ATP synthase subunit delta [Marinobacter sp. F4216]MDO3721361.1 F0F1 ATP synthase subunit delta [Marinobacter sp. chi1]